ncbi:hypothetical protein [Phragmitibacter flavus]|nr:hypothetical protein [Phragmitibacter flavus]
MLQSRFPRLATWSLLTLVTLGLATSCSKKPPTLEEIVDDAKATIKAGDTLSFIRLTNNGLLENVKVQKVEAQRILVTDNEPGSSPFWVNLDATVSYQQASLVRNLQNDGRTSHSSETQEITVISVQSIDEIATHLAKLSVGTPSGKKWEDLGILERNDWMAALNREAPDFIIPAAVIVSDVNEWWRLSIEGNYHLPADSKLSFKLKNHPAPASLEFLTNVHEKKSRNFPAEARDKIKTLKAGDTYNFPMVLRPRFSHSNSNGTVNVSLNIR